MLWNQSDGTYYGDMESHREAVKERAAKSFGKHVDVQLSSHGAGRYSAQVFDGKNLCTTRRYNLWTLPSRECPPR